MSRTLPSIEGRFGDGSICLQADNAPLRCRHPIEVPARAAPSVVARTILAALFHEATPTPLLGTTISVNSRNHLGGTIQFQQGEETRGAWWKDDVPLEVYEALESWIMSMVPPKHKAKHANIRVYIDQIGIEDPSILSEQAASCLHDMITSAVERHPEADLVMLEWSRHSMPRSLRGFAYGGNRYNIRAPGLQRWFADNATWFAAASSLTLSVIPDGHPETAPRPV